MENKNIVQEMFRVQDSMPSFFALAADASDQEKRDASKLANEIYLKLTRLAMTHWSNHESLINSCENTEDKSRLHNIFARMTFDISYKRDLFFEFDKINGFSIGVLGICRPMPYWNEIHGK